MVIFPIPILVPICSVFSGASCLAPRAAIERFLESDPSIFSDEMLGGSGLRTRIRG